MRSLMAAGLGLAAASAIAVAGQVVSEPKGGADYHSSQSLEEKGKALLADAAKSPSGVATQTLDTYAGSNSLIAARTGSGTAELHRFLSDDFFVVSGEANVVTGGRMIDGKDTAPGEVRGTKVEGGTPHTLRKGDVLHIAPNTPHQTLVAPGQTFIYYVIKVGPPPARMMPASR